MAGKGLFHYTTFDALEGILSNKEIWLGNLKYMNDRLEMEFFFKSLEEALVKTHLKCTDTIKVLFKTQLNRLKDTPTFAFSLSTTEEDASQWDRYANGGRGVCIKFNQEKLEECIQDKAFIQKVFYENVSKHQILALLDIYLKEGTVPNGFTSIDALFDNAWSCAVSFKHPSFKAEKEVRICSVPFTGRVHMDELKYVATKSGLREYLPIKLCRDIERDYGRAIEKITVGPAAGVDKNLVYRYLQHLGVDVSTITIDISTCPLR